MANFTKVVPKRRTTPHAVDTAVGVSEMAGAAAESTILPHPRKNAGGGDIWREPTSFRSTSGGASGDDSSPPPQTNCAAETWNESSSSLRASGPPAHVLRQGHRNTCSLSMSVGSALGLSSSLKTHDCVVGVEDAAAGERAAAGDGSDHVGRDSGQGTGARNDSAASQVLRNEAATQSTTSTTTKPPRGGVRLLAEKPCLLVTRHTSTESSLASSDPPSHVLKQGHKSAVSCRNLHTSVRSHSAKEQDPKHAKDKQEKDETDIDEKGSDSDPVRCNDDGDCCGAADEEREGDGFSDNEVDQQRELLEEEETFARDNAESRPLMLFFWNGVSSLIVFVRYLISIDSVLSIALSCCLTYYFYDETQDNESFEGAMSFVLLGFAVLMPLSVQVRITFLRREEALKNIAAIQTLSHSIYVCHAAWDWGKAPGGRSEDPKRWLAHSDQVLSVLVSIGDGLTRFLTLPNASFSRHRETRRGRREAAVTISSSYHIFGDIIENGVTDLGLLTETLKLGGFSPSEASRVRQYEKMLAEAVQKLRMLKMYRSPKALHALLNLTTTLLPPFYAPAFAQIAHDTGSLGLGIAFAAITALVLSALYESVQVLEDPFVAFLTLDGIDVYEELAVLYYHQLIQTRRRIFQHSSLFNEEQHPGGSNANGQDMHTNNEGKKLGGGLPFWGGMNQKAAEQHMGSSLPMTTPRSARSEGGFSSGHAALPTTTLRCVQAGSSTSDHLSSSKRRSVYELDLPEDFMMSAMRRRSTIGG